MVWRQHYSAGRHSASGIQRAGNAVQRCKARLDHCELFPADGRGLYSQQPQLSCHALPHQSDGRGPQQGQLAARRFRVPGGSDPCDPDAEAAGRIRRRKGAVRMDDHRAGVQPALSCF